MASSPDSREAGYATAAATVLSLALAMTATAATAFAVAQSRAARSDLARTQASLWLDGGHVLAASRLAEAGQSTRLRWRETLPEGAFEILAEPEAAKVNVEDLLSGGDRVLNRLGVTNRTVVDVWLREQLKSRRPEMVTAASPAPLWRHCAASLISYFGEADEARLTAAKTPVSGAVSRRAGAVWRVRVSSRGWTDDRLVRITGDGARPGIAIIRRLTSGEDKGEPCSALIES